MISKIKTFKTVGINMVPVTVECQITDGIGVHIVGLADEAVRQSLLRCVTALQVCGYKFPGKKIIVNIAPADLRKSESLYDLPITLAIIAASGQEDMPDADRYITAGEIGLGGEVRTINGAVTLADMDLTDMKGVIFPTRDALQLAEATQGAIPAYGVNNLAEAVAILKGAVPARTAWDKHPDKERNNPAAKAELEAIQSAWDAIKHSPAAVRIAEIAAAGGHGTFLMGNPGTGKASIARSIAALLPPMDEDEALTSDKIFSVSAREIRHGIRPFRNPHYSASIAALLGGGTEDGIRPGEVSLANGGVLYLDDWGLCPKAVKEALRVPMEDKKVTISRLKSKIEYPADFLPVLSSLPCACGYYGQEGRCTCTPSQRQVVIDRLGGPVIDKMDIQAFITSPITGPITGAFDYEMIKERVRKAREIQRKRFEGTEIRTNSEMTSRDLEKYCPLDNDCKMLIEKLITYMNLSARAYSHIIKNARTIADLSDKDKILPEFITEAAGYRFLDKNTENDHEQKTATPR